MFLTFTDQVAFKAKDYPHGYIIKTHTHDYGQMIYACEGVMWVRSDTKHWIVPPQRGVWIPAKTPHSIEMKMPVMMRTFYLRKQAQQRFPNQCIVVNISPLIRELILKAINFSQPLKKNSRQWQLVQVLLNELENIEQLPLQIIFPKEARIKKITNSLIVNPSCQTSLDAFATKVGASRRTIVRLFQQETGMTFQAWRLQYRLLCALDMLAQGKSVTNVAYSIGYNSVSAFINQFHKQLGCSPKNYY